MKTYLIGDRLSFDVYCHLNGTRREWLLELLAAAKAKGVKEDTDKITPFDPDRPEDVFDYLEPYLWLQISEEVANDDELKDELFELMFESLDFSQIASAIANDVDGPIAPMPPLPRAISSEQAAAERAAATATTAA